MALNNLGIIVIFDVNWSWCCFWSCYSVFPYSFFRLLLQFCLLLVAVPLLTHWMLFSAPNVVLLPVLILWAPCHCAKKDLSNTPSGSNFAAASIPQCLCLAILLSLWFHWVCQALDWSNHLVQSNYRQVQSWASTIIDEPWIGDRHRESTQSLALSSTLSWTLSWTLFVLHSSTQQVSIDSFI